MKTGRPTTYKEEYCDKVDEYLKECQDSYYSPVEDGVANKLRVNLPTVEGFALYIGVPKRTMYDWRETNANFSHSLDKIVQEQQKRLLNMGLSGEYNPTIAKLILSSNHGMSDKVETDITTLGKSINVERTSEEIALAQKYEEDLKKQIEE